MLNERKVVDEKNARNAVSNDPEQQRPDFRTAARPLLSLARSLLQRFLRPRIQTGRRRHSLVRAEPRLSYFGWLRWTGFSKAAGRPISQICEAELKDLTAALPPQYAFAHVIQDLADSRAMNTSRLMAYRRTWAKRHRAPSFPFSARAIPVPFKDGSGRRELAAAIADPQNPLTARVMVNRIWQHHFGDGLVRTVSNFGRMGETPSNPALLDYLATSFIRERLVHQEAASRNHAVLHLPAFKRQQPRQLRRGSRTIASSGAPIVSAWMRKRCAMNCSPCRASLTPLRAALPLQLGEDKESQALRLRLRQPPQTGWNARAVRLPQSRTSPRKSESRRQLLCNSSSS